MKTKLILALSAFVQIGLVACNTMFITAGMMIPMIVVSALISVIWSFNVKKIAFSSAWDRIWYGIGAGLGTYVGYIISHYFINT